MDYRCVRPRHLNTQPANQTASTIPLLSLLVKTVKKPILAVRHTHTHTHTHTHLLNGPLFRTTRVGQYQKSKTNLDFNGTRCKSAPRSRQVTTPEPHHSVFLQAGCPSCCPTNSVKALKASCTIQQFQLLTLTDVIPTTRATTSESM